MKTKLSAQQKFIFIFLLLLGNALMALFTFGEEEALPDVSPAGKSVERSGYINLRVKGNLKAELNSSSPVVCVGEKSGHVVKNVFVLKEYQQNFETQSFLEEQPAKEYLVSLPKEEAIKMLKNEIFAIYPHGLEFKTKRKKNHEIVY